MVTCLVVAKEEILYEASRGSTSKAFNEPEGNSPHLQEELPPIKRYNVV